MVTSLQTSKQAIGDEKILRDKDEKMKKEY